MPEDPAVKTLSRWSASGGTWRVLHRTSASVTISLERCDGGEEMERLTSSDPVLIKWLRGRSSSQD